LPADLIQYYQKLSLGFQAYFQSLNSYLMAEEPHHQIEAVTQAFDLYRILTAVRHGALGLNSLNHEMEKALFEYLPTLARYGDWYVGRPVMMSYNDYQLGLSNGDIGICLKHRQHVDQFEVYFPSLDKWIAATRLPKSMQTAFVLTIHKSQAQNSPIPPWFWICSNTLVKPRVDLYRHHTGQICGEFTGGSTGIYPCFRHSHNQNEWIG
jgi:exodeoxyribonuclease V alpha subunit